MAGSDAGEKGPRRLELGGLHGCSCTLGGSVAGGGAVWIPPRVSRRVGAPSLRLPEEASAACSCAGVPETAAEACSCAPLHLRGSPGRGSRLRLRSPPAGGGRPLRLRGPPGGGGGARIPEASSAGVCRWRRAPGGGAGPAGRRAVVWGRRRGTGVGGRRAVCVRCGGRGLGVGALGLVAWWAGAVAVVGWWPVGLGCLQK